MGNCCLFEQPVSSQCNKVLNCHWIAWDKIVKIKCFNYYVYSLQTLTLNSHPEVSSASTASLSAEQSGKWLWVWLL